MNELCHKDVLLGLMKLWPSVDTKYVTQSQSDQLLVYNIRIHNVSCGKTLVLIRRSSTLANFSLQWQCNSIDGLFSIVVNFAHLPLPDDSQVQGVWVQMFTVSSPNDSCVHQGFVCEHQVRVWLSRVQQTVWRMFAQYNNINPTRRRLC